MSELPDSYDDWKTRAPDDEPGCRDQDDVPCRVDDQRDDDPPEKCEVCHEYAYDLTRDAKAGWACKPCVEKLEREEKTQGLQGALESLRQTIEAVPPEVMAERKRQYEGLMASRAKFNDARPKPKRKRNTRKYSGMNNWR